MTLLENYPFKTINNRQNVIEYVRRWGGVTSDAILEPESKIFTVPHIEGLIGYRLELGRAIMIGDPVCAPSDIPDLAMAFYSFCKGLGLNVVYVVVSERFARWAIQNVCGVMLEFGKEFTLDTRVDDPTKGAGGALVRKKMKQASKAGVTVSEYVEKDKILEQKMEQLGESWRKARRGPQVFIAHIRLFEDREGKRWFYAMQNERVVGVLSISEYRSRDGWFFNRLMIAPDAPSGTSESLIVIAFEAMKSENYFFVTLGVAPSDHLGEIVGLSNFSKWIVLNVYKLSRRIFHLGAYAFWKKFQPKIEPSYVMFSESQIGLKDFWALMKVMNIGM